MQARQRSQRITPLLWFDDQAETAAKFYIRIFPRSRITCISRHREGGPGPVGSVMVVGFRLDGVEFLALNGGPTHAINPAISFVVSCDRQAEIDRLWNRLAIGGMTKRCGWLEDRFGVNWQIIPAALPRLIERGEAMQAMLGMDKIELAALQAASRARPGQSARAHGRAVKRPINALQHKWPQVLMDKISVASPSP